MKNDLDGILRELVQSSNCQIDYMGTKQISDGHLSDIVFVKVNCDYSKGEEKTLHLVVKTSKGTEEIRKNFNTADIFAQEIYFYEKVFPSFLYFQTKKEIRDVFNPLATCYKTNNVVNSEFLILSNLREDGFKLCDRKQPLDLKHLKMALVSYAKFHALSFALNDQEPEVFAGVTRKLKDVMKTHIRDGIQLFISLLHKQILQALQKRNESETYKKLKNLLDKTDLAEQTMDLMSEKTKYFVVNHNDAWINNLMFQYESNENTPSKLAIIDWQLVSVCNSPVYDISFLLYTCSSAEDLENVRDLLDIYYNSLKNFIQELGSDPNKIFPYEVFINHWRRYRLFGYMLFPMLMKFLFCSHGDIKSETAEKFEDCYNWIVDLVVEDKEYEDRLVGICKTFFLDEI